MDAFSEIVLSEDFVVLDTETTGLRDAEICQIAIIDAKGNVLLNTLVKPVRPIPSDAVHIHGITNEMVSTAPAWIDVMVHVEEILRGRHVYIYNADYDMSVLRSASRHANVKFIETWSNCFCVMKAFASFYGDWNEYRKSYTWKKLEVAAAHLGVPVSDVHSALGDCKMTLGVLKEMVFQEQDEEHGA